jgi:NADPH-dependent glutamate synthase beta subunit-like oxidoreductase
VFERQAMIGGLLTYGIPAFKLEKSILQRRFELFQQAGIEFRLNTEIGRDISLAQIETEFDAIFIGTGTYLPVREASLQISTNGVIESLEYLTAVNQDLLANQDIQYKSLVETKQVVVLGGGDTAMDCIRTSLRLGANAVTGVYRRTQSDMPGSAKEYLNACEEGAKFIFNAQPVAILAQDGQVTGVRFIQTKIEVDANKRKQLVNIVGSEFDVEADLVITAFGFQVEDLAWLESSSIERDKTNRRIKIMAKQLSQQTTNPKIFAGGDIVRGANLVVNAIADGMQGARDIQQFLLN